MMQKLTKQAIDDLTVDVGAETFLWDPSLLGFGVRARASGAKTYIYSYRPQGGRSASKRRYSIGRVESITLEQARKLAQQLAGHLASGVDPMRVQAEVRAEKERDRTTVQTLSVDFIDKYARPRNRTWRETERILNRYVLPHVGDVAVLRLSRREVSELLDTVDHENGPVMADRTLAALRKMLNWYETRDQDFRSPIVAGMARTSPGLLARDRVLTNEEIRAIWKAVDAMPYPFGPLVKVLFYTAQRRQEVAEARWDKFEDDLWSIPPAATRRRRGTSYRCRPLLGTSLLRSRSLVLYSSVPTA